MPNNSQLSTKDSQHPLISLCLIVGNVEEYIERCLKSFLPIADEICIARAIGNQDPDKTIELAEQICKAGHRSLADPRGPAAGAYLDHPIPFHWVEYKNNDWSNPDWSRWKNPGVNTQSWPHLDDFAAARNLAFSLATGKYIFWADTDDVLEKGAEAIREDAADGKWNVYVIPYNIFGRDVNIQRERMVRRGSGKWLYPVHECFSFDPIVEGALDERASVIHLPNLNKTGSNDRNLRILQAIPEEKLTPGLKYHLHGELIGTNQLDKAIKLGEEAAVSEELGIPERYEIFLNLGKLAKDPKISNALFHEAYKLDPERREALGLLICTEMDYGRTRNALAFSRSMMSLPPPEKANWNDRHSAYDWLGADIHQQALRCHGHALMKTDSERAKKHLKQAEKLRLDLLQLAAKSGRPLISLVHATRGRPLLASKARKMWLDLADRPDAIEHIFVFSQDDEKSYPLARMNHLMIAPGQGCVGGWNNGASTTNGEIIIQMSDDWIPIPQWDTAIIDRLKTASIAIQDNPQSAIKNQQFSFEPLVLAINDGHRADDLLCMAIMTRRYYELDNFMFHPRFNGMYSDNWFTHEAYRRKAVVDARDLVFTHNHPFFNPQSAISNLKSEIELDETYQLQNAPERYTEGKAIYEELLDGTDWSSVAGWFNYWPFYQTVAATLKDGDVVAEIGVFLGRSVIFLAQECKRLGKKIKIIAVDNFQGEPGQPEHAKFIAELKAHGTDLKTEFLRNVHRCGVTDYITLIEGDSVKAARQIPAEHLSFCYIDASHDFESVRNDITAWTPKMKKGNCLAGHDAQWEGVQKAVLQRFPNAYFNGPIWMTKV